MVNSETKGSPIPCRSSIIENDLSVQEASFASFTGETTGSWSGQCVSGVGDVNGDGYDDILISDSQGSENGGTSGETYLIFGKGSGWYAETSLSNADASFRGEHAGDKSGTSVSGVGDVNGDGYNDFMIGAHWNGDGGDEAGQVYLILGKKTGWEMDTDLSDVDASFWGEDKVDFAGCSVAGVGDVNGDGYDDILIGARGCKNGSVHEAGKSYLILGRTSGWQMDSDLSDADASFCGEKKDDYSGSVVAGAGDVNGDGYDDFLIGVAENDEGGSNSGQSYLILGKETGWGMGTYLSDSDASYIGEKSGDNAGISLDGCGDVNGDGYNDFIIGAYGNDEGGSNSGQSYLILGKETGWEMDTNLSEADASFIGEVEDDESGIQVAGVGDMNGDGFDDFMINAPVNDEAYVNAGQAYLILGRETGWGMDIGLEDSNASFVGMHIGDFVASYIDGAGDINGDGLDEIIIGVLDAHGYKKGITYILSTSGYTEPSSIQEIIVKNNQGEMIRVADRGEVVRVEMIGIDRDPDQIDIARFNVTFSQSEPVSITVSITETGKNTGVYVCLFKIPERAILFETLHFYPYIDPTIYYDMQVDYPFRPSSVQSLDVYLKSDGVVELDHVYVEQTVFFICMGDDSNPLGIDQAFVNLSSDKNVDFHPIVILFETGMSTGTYVGQYMIPKSLELYENITVTSVSTPSVTTRIMVHVPVELRAIGNETEVLEGSEYNATFYNFGFNDVAWKISTNADWLEWDVENNRIHGIPRNDDVSGKKWSVSVQIEDEYDHSSSIDYTIRVINKPPKISGTPITEMFENQEYLVDFDSDEDGEVGIWWSIASNTSFLNIDRKTGAVSGKPEEGQIGIFRVMVEVEDINFGRSSIYFNLRVKKIDERPVIITEDILQATEDVTYQNDYNFADNDTGESHLWALSTNADWLQLNEESGLLFGTPGNDDVGDWEINITVTDSKGLSDSRVFVLSVININDEPVFEKVPGDLDLVHGAHYYFDVNASDPDIGAHLLFGLSTKPVCGMTIDQDTGEIEWLPSINKMPDDNSAIKCTLSVSDGEYTVKHNFNIRVLPTASPIVDIFWPSSGTRTVSSLVELKWSGSDRDNDPLTYTLYVSNTEIDINNLREYDIILQDTEKINHTLSDLKEGKVYYWVVIPYDGCTSGSCDGGVLNFRVNNRPFFEPVKNPVIEAGEPFKMKITGYDEDEEDTIHYSVTKGPLGLTINNETGMMEWNPSDDQAVLHDVTIQISDGFEQTSIDFKIVVEKGETPPSSSILVYVSIGVVLFIVMVGFIVILFLRNRSRHRSQDKEDTRTPEEIEKEKDAKMYEDLYGVAAPEKEEEGLTTKELKDYIHTQIVKLEEEDVKE